MSTQRDHLCTLLGELPQRWHDQAKTQLAGDPRRLRPDSLGNGTRVWSTTSTPVRQQHSLVHWTRVSAVPCVCTLRGAARTRTMVSSISRIASPAAHTAAAVDAGEPSTPTTIRSMATCVRVGSVRRWCAVPEGRRVVRGELCQQVDERRGSAHRQAQRCLILVG